MNVLTPYEQGSQAFLTEFIDHVVVPCRYPTGSSAHREWTAGYQYMDLQIQQEMS